MYPKLFEPIKIGNVQLKNRIVFAPVTTGYEEKRGNNGQIPEFL